VTPVQFDLAEDPVREEAPAAFVEATAVSSQEVSMPRTTMKLGF
jgi:hypothetical protein